MSQSKTCLAVLDSVADQGEQLTDLLRPLVDSATLITDVQALFALAAEQQLDCLLINARDDHELLTAAFRQRALSTIDCPIVVMVDEGEVELAVAAVRFGAVDVIQAPVTPEQFVERMAEFAALPRQSDFTCEAEQSRQLVMLSERVAQTDVTVLINGESGTGKEVLARHIHDNSQRADKPFIALNCASIPESMLEDMLFGHEKGAFTGADKRYEGLFEQAHRGTLFLDEIGEMPIVLQAKILRVLQERELRRLGGSELVKLDVRVIAATNRDLAVQVREREFREDLFYRLNVFPLKISPLRERIEDILPIAAVLMKKHRKTIGNRCRLSKATQQFFKAYPWPGNVRELENVVQRAMVLAFDGVIEVEHLLLENDLSNQAQAMPQNSFAPETVQPQQSSAESFVPQRTTIHQPYNDTPVKATEAEEVVSLSDMAWESESRMILNTLSRFSGNRKSTAENLGISPRTLRYKLAKLKDEGVAIP